MRLRIASLAAMTAVLYPITVPPASAHEPYGGCDEAWQAPRSEGARHCRVHERVNAAPWTAWWPSWSWFGW